MTNYEIDYILAKTPCCLVTLFGFPIVRFLISFTPFKIGFRDWSLYAANFIYRQISVKGNTFPVQEINIICQKTVKDLRGILSKLEEFQSKILPEDQNKGKMVNC